MENLMNSENVKKMMRACAALSEEERLALLSEKGLELFYAMSGEKDEWSDSDIDEVVRRARRGEKVVL